MKKKLNHKFCAIFGDCHLAFFFDCIDKATLRYQKNQQIREKKEPSGLLLAMFDLYYLYASINKQANCGTYKLIYKVCDCAAYVGCNRQASDYDVDSLNSVIYLRN